MRNHGPFVEGDRTLFSVWAPEHDALAIRLVRSGFEIPLARDERGYHLGETPGVAHGDRYLIRLADGRELPDPASRWQPEGVAGPSAVLDPSRFTWTDAEWRGIELADLVIMELHVGTFTGSGTFRDVIEQLPELRALGVNAIELMPVAQFPGARNWGYDGVFPYAAQNTYGGPEGLAQLVDEAHRAGVAVILDVVYNHLGPEGAVLGDFGPYFTERYRTPWGQAVNVDGPHSDEVRRYFIDNALSWVEDFHIDGLRLDAIHGIFDMSPQPFLRQLSEEVHALGARLGRPVILIAESESNDNRVVSSDGFAMDAQWNDDFHHAVHAALTGESDGYYGDYGPVEQIGVALAEGFVFQGQYSAYRARSHGSPAASVPAERLVVCIQNHDQVGNRLYGDRLSRLIPRPALRVAAALLLTAPQVPMLFMGEEYGETAPFLYFVSHSDPDLLDAVRKGRAEEFAAFAWNDEPPDPGDEQTFVRSKLDRSVLSEAPYAELYDLYKQLLALRRARPALRTGNKEGVTITCSEENRTLAMRRRAQDDEVLVLFNLGHEPTPFVLDEGRWRALLGDADADGDTVFVPGMSFAILGAA